MRSPSSPWPWKLYGDDRGLNAPPRRNLPPARFTAAAVALTCSSVSAEHGPAMTITSSPPIRTSPTSKTVLSRLNVRLASLYGSEIRTTSFTPSRTSSSRGSRCRPAPTAPSTVRCAPVERCTSNPCSTRCATTFWICSSLAPSAITTTMDHSPLALRTGGPRESLMPALGHRAFEAAGLVDDPFEQPRHGVAIERARVDAADVPQHRFLARRLVDLHLEEPFQPADLDDVLGPAAEQLDQLRVGRVDRVAADRDLRQHLGPACRFIHAHALLRQAPSGR